MKVGHTLESIQIRCTRVQSFEWIRERYFPFMDNRKKRTCIKCDKRASDFTLDRHVSEGGMNYNVAIILVADTTIIMPVWAMPIIIAVTLGIVQFAALKTTAMTALVHAPAVRGEMIPMKKIKTG